MADGAWVVKLHWQAYDKYIGRRWQGLLFLPSEISVLAGVHACMARRDSRGTPAGPGLEALFV